MPACGSVGSVAKGVKASFLRESGYFASTGKIPQCFSSVWVGARVGIRVRIKVRAGLGFGLGSVLFWHLRQNSR